MICNQLAYLLQSLVVQFEGPELKAGGQAIDGGQGEQELLCCAQREVGIGELSLLDLLLLLLCGGHGQDLLLRTERGPIALKLKMKQQMDQTVIRPHTGSHPYLDALFANGELVEAENCRLDDVDRWQDGHTDVDGVTPL